MEWSRWVASRRVLAMSVLLGLIIAILWAVALAYASPAAAQEGQSPDTVEVSFEVIVDGEVPEGTTLGLDLPGTADISGAFCSNAPGSQLSRCEEGNTYTATFFSLGNATSPNFPTAAGRPLPYEYMAYSGPSVDTFAAGTVTPERGTTVSATYRPGDEQQILEPEQPAVDQYDNEQGLVPEQSTVKRLV